MTDMARFKPITFPAVAPGDRIAVTSMSGSRVRPAPEPGDTDPAPGCRDERHLASDCEHPG